MEPQIRYARTTDGVRIAYTRVGSGPPVLFTEFAFGFQPTLEAHLLLHDALLSSARVTYFDDAGCGASDRDVEDLSVEARVRTLEAVVAACMNDERFTLIAMATACPGAALYATAHAAQVERLICISPQPPWVIPAVVRGDWSIARRMMAGWAMPDGPVERQRWFSQTVRSSISQATYIASSEAYQAVDQVSVFEQVRVPALFIAPATSEVHRQHATRLAAAVEGARLVLIDGTGPIDDDRAAVQACLAFVGIESALVDEDAHGEVAVILFADIADSTALTERMGDAGFRAAARALDEGLRTRIRASGGKPVEGKVLGDGVMAVFTSAVQAIGAARHCIELSRESGLQLHVGLHAGDVIREEGNVYGGAVNIASRICALSAADELLVSGTIRDLARTSAGVAFEDRGDHALKGVADAVRVYAVKLSVDS